MLDIQKLAAEMDLKCITSYKLDALKSVQQINISDSQEAPECVESENNQRSNSSTPELEMLSETALGCTRGEFMARMPVAFLVYISETFVLYQGRKIVGLLGSLWVW